MTPSEQQHFDFIYKQHLTNLRLQGKRPATIDGYSRAVRLIASYRRVRDFGLLPGANRKKLKEIQHQLAILLGCALPKIDTVRTKAIKLCACCKQPMQFMGIKKTLAKTLNFNVPFD